MNQSENNFFQLARQCLLVADMDEKVSLTKAVAASFSRGELYLDSDDIPQEIAEPGRPACLKLVDFKGLPQRKLSTKEGRAALIHSLVHIEFNAINLAWDAAYRFRAMPAEYYADWCRIAAEEAYHFQLLRQHLKGLGYDYGDFPAHDGLWDMAMASREDVLVRMAVIPRTMEARGLDVTPGIRQKLQQSGDTEAAKILDIILADEIGHVQVGTRWFVYECERRGLDREQTFYDIIDLYMQGQIRKPLYHEARMQAGFTRRELDYLEGGKRFAN